MHELAQCSPVTASYDTDHLAAPERKCRQIITLVASEYTMTAADIQNAARGSQKVAFARQVAMYLAHVGFGLCFATVGGYFQRDRTTVAHACRVIEDRRDDTRFDCRMAALEMACRAAAGGLR